MAITSCATTPARTTTHAAALGGGWQLLTDGKSDVARAAFDAALAKDANDREALYGRALIAQESGDLERAWQFWLRLLAASTDAPEFALAAARRVELLVGELPGEHPTAAAELAAVDADKLSPAATRRLFAARARQARRDGDEAAARRFDGERGCPDHAFFAGPYGRLPRLDLARAFPPDSGGDRARYERLPARACSVSYEVPIGRAGVVYVGGWARAKEPLATEIVVENDAPWRLVVDGRELFAHESAERYLPHEEAVPIALPAGWHRVFVKTAATGRGELSLSVRGVEFFDGEATAAPEPPSGARETARLNSVKTADPSQIHESTADPTIRALLAMEAADALGDVDAGERLSGELIARAPRFAVGRLLAARLALADTTRPARFAQDRARRQLERALSIDPALTDARFRLAMLALDAERPRDALARLAEGPKPPAGYWRFALGRYLALHQRDWMVEAEAALADARKLAPRACAPIEAELQVARERQDVTRRLRLAKLAARCDGGSDDYADALRDSGDLAAAIAEYRRLVALDPARDLWRAGLAEALASSGRPRDAATIYAELVKHHPRHTIYRRDLADALVATGDEAGARRALEAGTEESPENTDLRRALEALCAPDRPCGPIDPFRVDGKQVIAAYERDRKERGRYEAPAVIVLDRTVTRVFPTGARLTLTHNIMQVLTKDGIEKFGEVTIPQGADLLTLRTVKADGTTREPEEIAEKESVSVPDLEAGDYVEFEYVEPAQPPGAFPGGFLAERFFFQSYDAPLDRTEYLLVTPKGMPLELDRRGEAPELVVEKRGDLELRTWAGRRRPQVFSEPAAAPFSEYLPSVRAASGLSIAGWRDELRDAEQGAWRANPELRALAERETRGLKSDAEKVHALDLWTRRHIKDGGLLDDPATSILAREEGRRVTLLGALLQVAGVPSEIWLSRREPNARLDGPLPDLEAFDHPLLYVPSLKKLLDPAWRHSPTGFVTPVARGMEAMRLVGGDAKLGRVDATGSDDRKMEIAAALALDGSAEVTVRERLRGWPALEWREALDKLPPDRVRPEFEQHTLGNYFPGSTLIDLHWSGADDDEGLFTVEYKFRAPQLARRVGRSLLLPAPYPATLGARYVGVAERKTPLLLDYTPATVLEARFTVPPSVELELAPAARTSAFGRFTQSAEKISGGLVLRAEFQMDAARIPPDRYRAFVEFATTVDRAEARVAELRPPSRE